jgi:hypothetical protein
MDLSILEEVPAKALPDFGISHPEGIPLFCLFSDVINS